jgi:hypothetical protein
VTPTPTPRVPNGGFCDEPSDCRSANCVDNVCAPVLPVPAASGRGIAVALLALAAIGGLALVRRGRASSVPDGIAGDR